MPLRHIGCGLVELCFKVVHYFYKLICQLMVVDKSRCI